MQRRVDLTGKTSSDEQRYVRCHVLRDGICPNNNYVLNYCYSLISMYRDDKREDETPKRIPIRFERPEGTAAV